MSKNKHLLNALIIWFVFSFIISLGFVLGCQRNPEQKQIDPKPPAEDKETDILKQNIKNYVQTLADEKYQGRRAGTAGEAEAGLYLASQLKKIGLKPLGEKGTYFQTFLLPSTDIRQNGKRAEFYLIGETKNLLADNIIGIWENEQSAQEYILLSAHYDHLGTWQDNIYPGANDNASGVAAILEIIRVLSESDQIPYSIVVAFWSGEEMGLLGSNYFITNPTFELAKIKLAINLDSIGNGKDNEFIIWHEDNNSTISRFLSELKENQDLQFLLQNSQEHTSDHKALAKAGVPAVSILAKDWLNNNHTSEDTSMAVNYNKIVTLSQEIVNLIRSTPQWLVTGKK